MADEIPFGLQAILGTPFVSTPGYGQAIGGLELLLAEAQRQQQAYIIEQYKLYGEDALTTLFANSNRETPQYIKDVTRSKILYIKNLLGASIRERNSTKKFVTISHNLDAEGTVIFNQGKMSGPSIGTFIQNAMIFGEVNAKLARGESVGEEFAGASAAKPDLQRILTELKVGTKMPTKANEITAVVPSGLISGGITGAATNATAIEKQLMGMLTDENLRKNLAIFELYTKMRNFLYIRTELTHPNNSWVLSRIHFVAIVLYIEIIIAMIRAWVETGIPIRAAKEHNWEETKKQASEKKAGRKYWADWADVPIKPHIDIKFESIGKDPVAGGFVTVSAHYDINIRDLDANEEGVNTNDVNIMLKNIEKLYLYRENILPYISGEGTGQAARNFFSILKELELPGWNMANMNLPINI